MQSIRVLTMATAFVLTGSAISFAQTAQDSKTTSTAPQADKPASAPSLVIYFDSGSSRLRAEQLGILDRASRAYSEGKPIVMILTGTSDRVGNAQANLALSERRASAVLAGLIDRGIPADRFQVLAKGQTELPVPTAQGVAEAQNRRVEITWR